jgi:hypothetical protein
LSVTYSPSYVLYIDDSGQKEYPPDGVPFAEESSGRSVSRYFVFGGFYATPREVGRLVEGLRAAKQETFGTTAVEVKSNWLRLPEEREKRYLRPYNITDAQLNAFVDRFYSEALNSKITLLACVVDKQHMIEDYGRDKWYTPAAAYESVVQRLQNEVGASGQKFGVIVDDMTGKTPNASAYRDNLIRHHRQLQRSGCNFVTMSMGAMVGDLGFVNSRNSNPVQVSDLIAYNVFRQFRDYGEYWEDRGLPQLPAYHWFRRIAPKFRRGPNDRIQGYGVVKFPLRERVPWRHTLRKD